jgi:hypothetical protein
MPESLEVGELFYLVSVEVDHLESGELEDVVAHLKRCKIADPFSSRNLKENTRYMDISKSCRRRNSALHGNFCLWPTAKLTAEGLESTF